ncbi:MAG: archease [Nitrospiraceae bacterium]|nr:archease [Nitrospiraceae bacterium]
MDISGDAGIRATGGSLEEAFAAAATGMYSLITDLADVEEKKSIEVSAEADSQGGPEGLLVGFLNELVFHFDAYGFIGRRVEIRQLAAGRIRAVVHGEEFDRGRHRAGLLIKAATYHGLKIENAGGLWGVEVIFDI